MENETEKTIVETAEQETATETTATKSDAKSMGNPREYVYPNDVNVEIEGHFLTELITAFEKLVNDEVEVKSDFKYKYVNEKGNVVKTPKQVDIESGKVKKILDFDRTVLNPSFSYTLSEKGVYYAKLKHLLEAYHITNIGLGKAVSYKEYSEKLKNK